MKDNLYGKKTIVRQEIFIAYAHEDHLLVTKIMKLLQKGHLKISTYEIWPGDNASHQPLSGDVILLMVSPDFLNSDYCYTAEIIQAIEQHKLGKKLVIPILLRPIYWGKTPFADLKVLPNNGKPITMQRIPSQSLQRVVVSIQGMISTGKSTIPEPKAISPFSHLIIRTHRKSPSVPSREHTYKHFFPSSGLRLTAASIIVVILLATLIIFGFYTKKTGGFTGNPYPTEEPISPRSCSVNLGTWTQGEPDWSIFGGILHNNGSNGTDNGPTILAPCQPGVVDYDIETKIQIINSSLGCFGIVFGGFSQEDSWQGYKAGACGQNTVFISAYQSSTSVQVPFMLGAIVHMYHLAVRGDTARLSIDGRLLATITDKLLIAANPGEEIGLYSQHVRLQVSSFVVTSVL